MCARRYTPVCHVVDGWLMGVRSLFGDRAWSRQKVKENGLSPRKYLAYALCLFSFDFGGPRSRRRQWPSSKPGRFCNRVRRLPSLARLSVLLLKVDFGVQVHGAEGVQVVRLVLLHLSTSRAVKRAPPPTPARGRDPPPSAWQGSWAERRRRCPTSRSRGSKRCCLGRCGSRRARTRPSPLAGAAAGRQTGPTRSRRSRRTGRRPW